MGHSPAVIVEGIARPDTAVGIVETIIVGIIITLLPVEVAHEYRPHPTHEDGIRIVLEVPEQFVDVVQIHVVVVHDVRTVGVAHDIAVGIHLRAPRLGCTRQALLRILRRMRDAGFDIGNLTVGVGREVRERAIRLAQHICQITSAPASKIHAPHDGTMQPHLSVPGTVGSGHQRTAQGVDIGVGGVEDDLVGQPLMVLPGLVVEGFGLCTRRCRERIGAGITVEHGIGCWLGGLPVGSSMTVEHGIGRPCA